MGGHTTQAIIFLLNQHFSNDLDRCTQYCAAVGYDVVAVVTDRWTEVIRYLRAGFAEVVVIADRSRLPSDRTPRIEVVAEQHGDDPRFARTLLLKRNAARSPEPHAAADRPPSCTPGSTTASGGQASSE